MPFPDWGSVPAWLGAGSLLLAFRIFLRDRASTDRAQVDRVGAWFDLDHERVPPWGAIVDEVKLKVHIHNGSELPVDVIQVAWRVDSRWSLPDTAQSMYPVGHPNYPGVWMGDVHGKPDSMRFIGRVKVAPQTTWDADLSPINMAHAAPDVDASLDGYGRAASNVVITHMLVTDNAGRRWVTQVGRGRRAQRVMWYSKAGEHFPVSWQSPARRALRTCRDRIRSWITVALDRRSSS